MEPPLIVVGRRVESLKTAAREQWTWQPDLNRICLRLDCEGLFSRVPAISLRSTPHPTVNRDRSTRGSGHPPDWNCRRRTQFFQIFGVVDPGSAVHGHFPLGDAEASARLKQTNEGTRAFTPPYIMVARAWATEIRCIRRVKRTETRRARESIYGAKLPVVADSEKIEHDFFVHTTSKNENQQEGDP